MAARGYTVDDVLAHMEIPLPDEDDFSEDEFGGYLSSEDEDGQGGMRLVEVATPLVNAFNLQTSPHTSCNKDAPTI